MIAVPLCFVALALTRPHGVSPPLPDALPRGLCRSRFQPTAGALWGSPVRLLFPFTADIQFSVVFYQIITVVSRVVFSQARPQVFSQARPDDTQGPDSGVQYPICHCEASAHTGRGNPSFLGRIFHAACICSSLASFSRWFALPQRSLCGLHPEKATSGWGDVIFASALAVRIASQMGTYQGKRQYLCLSARCADCITSAPSSTPTASTLPQRSLCGLHLRPNRFTSRAVRFASALAVRIASAILYKKRAIKRLNAVRR